MNVGRYLRGEDLHVGTSRITKPKELKMNERIKELAKEAKEYASSFAYAQAIGQPGYQEKFSEKFAELLITKCIEGIKEWRDASDEHMDKEEYWKGYRSGCNDAIVEIIQRFGVEE